ncbi:hypothetical protein QM012_009012 [Aureobasidium pullulans]|uniref:F-box domain-containing protein n=1 Tax=Aureobasidium pullulans TaxID=5580 RepID=A0ABR0TJ51_AURPU
MDALPMELKQRICSFLSPKHLKPLRLTCKVFATAAERYFINRFILFFHPKSAATLRKIALHETLGKYLTTIVCDLTGLRWESWESSRRRPLKKHRWDDYRPKTLTLNTQESYAELTTRTMRNATSNYAAAWVEVQAHRLRLKELFSYQRSPNSYDDLGIAIKFAFSRCRRLRNVVLSSCHSTTVNKARARIFEVAHSERWWNLHNEIPGEAFWETSALESLTLIETSLPTSFPRGKMQAMSDLRHLRVRLDEDAFIYNPSKLRRVFEDTTRLETLSLFASDTDITGIVNVIRSSSLRICLIDFSYVQGDALVDFLLYHANTLQRLAIGVGVTDIGWSPVLCSISGKFPALKRVQLEALRSRRNQFVMRRDAELQAERFVLSGGLRPLIQYTSLNSEAYRSRGRGFSPYEVFYTELPPGLWTDYEYLANKFWDGCASDDKDMNDGEDGFEEVDESDDDEEEEEEDEEEQSEEDDTEDEEEDEGEYEDD